MAARQFDETFVRAFSNNTLKSSAFDYLETPDTITCYLEVPIKKDVFEIPVLTLNAFKKMAELNYDNVDAITITLINFSKKARYTTPDRNMRDILIADWEMNKLVYIPITQNGHTTAYYGGHGILLTKDLIPIVMMSWQIERMQNVNENLEMAAKYQFIKPILRIDPNCFGSSDPMMKWCANKLFKTGLVEKVVFGGNLGVERFITNRLSRMLPSIVIEKSPFNIRIPDMPNALTTREDILQPAIDHIDDLIL